MSAAKTNMNLISKSINPRSFTLLKIHWALKLVQVFNYSMEYSLK